MIKKIISFISHLSKRERVILYCAFFFISVFILAQLILIPIAAKISFLDAEIHKQEEAIKNELLILTRRKQIEEERKRYQPYFKHLEPKGKKTVTFLKNIEKLVKKSRVNLLDIRPTGPEKAAPFQKYLFTLNCEAPMERILDFFHRVESSDQLLRIESFRITPKGGKSSLSKCTMEISKVVMLKEKFEE